jgi:hypothetical protein
VLLGGALSAGSVDGAGHWCWSLTSMASTPHSTDHHGPHLAGRRRSISAVEFLGSGSREILGALEGGYGDSRTGTGGEWSLGHGNVEKVTAVTQDFLC